jgi:hypothetical protein
MTLGAIATVAAGYLLADEKIGGRFADSLTYTAFRVDGRRGLSMGDLLRTITVVRAGQPVRVLRWQDVTMDDVLASADALVLPGWPTHQYLVYPAGFGDFPGGDWVQVVEFLTYVWEFIAAIPERKAWWDSVGKVADVAGAAAAAAWTAQQIAKLKRRSADSAAALKATSGLLDARQLTPLELHRILKVRSWSGAELGALLGIPVVVAEQLAQIQGLERDRRTGRWELAPEPEMATTVLHDAFHMAVGMEPDRSQVPAMVARALNESAPGGAIDLDSSALTAEPGLPPTPEELFLADLRDALAGVTSAVTPLRQATPAPPPPTPPAPVEPPPRVEYWEGPGAVDSEAQTQYLVKVVQRLRAHRDPDPTAAVHWHLWTSASTAADLYWGEPGRLSLSRVRDRVESDSSQPSSITAEQLEGCTDELDLRDLLYDDYVAALKAAITACGPSYWKAWVGAFIDKRLEAVIYQLQHEAVDFEKLALHRWDLRFEYFLLGLKNQHASYVTTYALRVRPQTPSG